ncbi:MAG: hypothetical protein AAFO79_08890, partial [Pseudomonadota bacterium]
MTVTALFAALRRLTLGVAPTRGGLAMITCACFTALPGALSDAEAQQRTVARPAIAAQSAGLRIATWHLQDLWHQDGEPLRESSAAAGLVRDRAAWARLRQVADNLDADVIALQGAGSLRTVRRLFPARTHQVIFSQQLAQRLSRDPRVLRSPAWRQGYTALAVRRRRGLRVVAKVHLRGLITDAAVARASVSPPVAGTAVQLLLNGQALWVVSANIDGDCPRTATASELDALDRTAARACAAANEQADVPLLRPCEQHVG